MTPDNYTIQEQQLDVGDGHQLYVHDWGHKEAAQTILFLHGGPGGHCRDSHKRYFDGSRQRVIFFDQRGSGNSTPKGSLNNNTTADLVDDIIKILDNLGLDKVIVMGGSWGSCLALAFGIASPSRVEAMVLSGIFTGRQSEIDWLNAGHYQTFYPEVWQAYLDKTPPEHHANPTYYHFERILGSNETATKESAYTFNSMDGALMRLDDRYHQESFEDFDPTTTIIEAHYFSNGCFMPDGRIMNNAHVLTMPVYIMQSRYDMVCPPINAYGLHKQLPQSELIWTIGGHATEHESWNVIRTLLLQLTKQS